jgi:hypothetical protein
MASPDFAQLKFGSSAGPPPPSGKGSGQTGMGSASISAGFFRDRSTSPIAPRVPTRKRGCAPTCQNPEKLAGGHLVAR